MIDSFEGRVWRHVPAGAHPLHAGWILRAAGRWNRPGRYGWRRYVERGGASAARRPRDLVSITIRVRPVADLIDAGFRRRHGATLQQLTGDEESDWEACRSLADVLRAERYRALHVPSAALTGSSNLIIYLEGPASALVMDEGGDRVALNYGADRIVTVD